MMASRRAGPRGEPGERCHAAPIHGVEDIGLSAEPSPEPPAESQHGLEAIYGQEPAAWPTPCESARGSGVPPPVEPWGPEIADIFDRYRDDYGSDDGLAPVDPRPPANWRWGRCQRCDKIDIDLEICAGCSRLVCQERCWPNVEDRCWSCIPNRSLEHGVRPNSRFSWV
ncbi:hypothetical protein N9L68_01995 [bacterium]|nr:hypothetical protein [bacterium]